jgi:hypothetical protein
MKAILSSSSEHNLNVIADADYLVDMEPEAGENGGRVVAAGTPEQAAKNKTARPPLSFGRFQIDAEHLDCQLPCARCLRTRDWHFELTADGAGGELLYFPVPWHACRLPRCSIPPDGVLASFAIKVAAVVAQMAFEVREFQTVASSIVSRRLSAGSC